MMKKLVSVLMIACLVLTMLPIQAFAATPSYVEVTKSSAPLRTGKAEKYSVVAWVNKGTVLEITESALNLYLHRWYRVRLNTTDGVKSAWIYAGNVKTLSSASGYTTAIKMDKTDVSLNLRGTKTATLSAVMKYKNRTESKSLLVWSSSNPSVATVDSNGKVTAKGVGVATVTVKHKLFSTTATATIKVTEQVTLGVKAKEQSNSSCCSGAAAAAVLKFLNGSSKTDLQLYKEMGSEGVVYKVVNILNKHLGKTVYKYGTYSSQSKFVNAVKSSLNAGYPAIALVKVTSKTYTKYTTNGHFVALSGYKINTDGSVELRVTDSWKTSSNGGTYWVPAKTFFGYSAAHRYPYYLILKK